MNSSRLKSLLFTVVLVIPSLALVAMVGVLVIGAWVTSVLKSPASFDRAPAVIQQLTRSIYLWNARVLWQQQVDCIEFDEDTLYRPRPGACAFRNVEFSTVTSFDSRGTRLTKQPDRMTRSTATAPRLVVLGDSFAMGWGVNDAETFASVLSSEHGFHVVNLAVSSFGTVREILRLKKLGELEPGDVVIIQYCDNDFRENAHFLEHGKLGPYEKEDLAEILSDREMPIHFASVSAAVFGNLALAAWQRTLKTFGDNEGSADVRRVAHSPAEALEMVLQYFDVFEGHRVIIVPVNDWGRDSHLLPGKDVLQSSGVLLLEPTFEEDDFFRIDGHLTAKGHRAVARAILSAIRVHVADPLSSAATAPAGSPTAGWLGN